MPFFANIDIAWPWMAAPGRKGGSYALESGSRFLDFVREMEDDVFTDSDSFARSKNRVIHMFIDTGYVFRDLGVRIESDQTLTLTDADLEEAGIDRQFRDFDYGGMVSRRNFSVKQACGVLCRMMEIIVQALESLSFEQDRRDQARAIASAARHWEHAYRLGRIVGVVSWRLASSPRPARA